MAQVKRLFLDANVIFTGAHNPQGLTYALLQRTSLLSLKIYTSEYALEEARYNLALKFPNTLNQFEKLKKQLEIIAVSVDEKFNPLKLPPDDLPIFQGALQCRAEYLLTGDKKAFGKWMNKPEQTYGIQILTVRNFVDSLIK